MKSRKLPLLFTLLICSLSCNLIAQNINIPDPIFKDWLVGQWYINTNDDDEIDSTEAATWTGPISVSSLGIKDATGIEHFTNISELQISSNSLDFLDVSKCVGLTELYCNFNNLEKLNVSSLVNLEKLTCAYNYIDTLDLSNNSKLLIVGAQSNVLSYLGVLDLPVVTKLLLYDNLLTSLDVSKCSSLVDLDCSINLLTSLNLKNGNNDWMYEFNTKSNESLFCVEVDDLSNSSYMLANKYWLMESDSLCSENCSLGIEGNSVDNTEMIAVYDLLGRKVSKPIRGIIYIVMTKDGRTYKTVYN